MGDKRGEVMAGEGYVSYTLLRLPVLVRTLC